MDNGGVIIGYKKGFNSYKINGEITTIYLKKKSGEIIESYIDTEDLERIKKMDLSWNASWEKRGKVYYVKATEYLGYIDEKPKYKSHYMHKEILNYNKNGFIDHLDNNPLNNCKSNLRITINYFNSKNRKSKNSNNSSGYRNVCWNKEENKWMVQLQINGKNTVLGWFKDVDLAGEFAERMREKYYGKFKGNN